MQMSGGKGSGQQPKGERRLTGKPEFKDKPGKLPKGVRPDPDRPGQYQVWDSHKGNWVTKPKGWSPATQRVIAGAAAGALTGYIIYRAVRMIPSLFPPLWPTIPVNAAIP